ncbi:MAG: histidine kinase [Bacteroidetes bacterium]|nr:histidine kinase [Bacteroidota bacterium]
MNLKFLLLLIILNEAWICTYSQATLENSHPFFHHITTNNGLSGNQINCIYRDHRGFLWIGTENGLNEYDGRHINIYRHNRFDNSSIVNNKIISITEDDSGYLWLGTIYGISKFNPYNHKSLNFTHDDNNPYSLNENYKCVVYFDKNHTCWIGNESGLSYLNRKTNQFFHVQILPDSLNKFTLSSVGSILEDKRGGFWLGTYSGLVLFNRENHSFKKYTFKDEPQSKAENAITSLFCDHAGRIWAGFWGKGICEFDPVKKIFHSYTWHKHSRFAGTSNIVNHITETQNSDGQYILWVATTEGLLKISSYPITDKNTTLIVPDPAFPNSLSDRDVQCLLADHSNILWIGTTDGLNQYSVRNHLFTDEIAFNGSPTKIIIDTNFHTTHYYVSSWYGNGVIQLDSNLALTHTWKRIPEGSKEPDSRQVSDILQSTDGTFWIATFHGVFHYSKEKKLISSFLHNPSDPNSLSTNKTTSLGEDKNGNIWIGTYGMGVDVLNTKTLSFTHFVHKKNNSESIPDNLVWNIFIDPQKNIWIISNSGIALYHPSSQSFTVYHDEEKNPNSLKGEEINGMLQDSKGNYWIITDKGLNKFDLGKKQFILYSTEEGLNYNNIYSITEDKQGILWMCTPGGISSFNPATGNFINYDEQNGLPHGISGPMITLENGTIMAGGDNLLLKFDPSEFRIRTEIPDIYITQMSVAGSTLSFSKPLTQSGEIELHYPQNSFTCNFTSPDFFNGNAVKFAYRLTGVDAGWVSSGNRDFLSYSNLAPGSYTLHIKAANSDGVWNDKGISLAIKVLPPFWKTLWFRILLISLMVLGIYLLFIFRVRNIRKKEALKTEINKQMADMRLKVLRTRINPHFMFNALNSIQECIYTKKTDAASKYLSKFSLLLRQILEQSENTFITISDEIRILKLYLELESLRFDDGFIYHINNEIQESDFIKIPPMLVQPFVENALWHGLRHKEGEKKLSVTFSCIEEFINIIIEDNGIGREAAKAISQNYARKKESFGIKISEEEMQMVGTLSKQKPEIKIEDLVSQSGEPQGTRVILSVPVLHNS